jgi:hypothetical protein
MNEEELQDDIISLRSDCFAKDAQIKSLRLQLEEVMKRVEYLTDSNWRLQKKVIEVQEILATHLY